MAVEIKLETALVEDGIAISAESIAGNRSKELFLLIRYKNMIIITKLFRFKYGYIYISLILILNQAGSG